MSLVKLLFIVSLSMLLGKANAQNNTDQVYVDDNGIMRWSLDNSELHGFGVNYTLPFAHEYRMAQKTGIPLEDLIKQDVYHMARLDLDLYRVHVWDTEISDTLGNLINNDHLRLFDFAVNEMKQRGMRFIITPIAYWDNGWPEPNKPTPGFAHKYGKDSCLTNPKAIEAQANYLNQFLKHINPFTGIAYKDESFIIGFEICNEPHHNESAEKVTMFINRLVASMRQTGCTKPIFYNMSQNIDVAEAYLNTNIQGGTFQWYPTNLVANHQIDGNFLPQVEIYQIPFADHPKFKKMAKIVYEFDPADVGTNIMYPAMALTFRENGMQLAAQFAYDAMCWAPYNTNYGTHFMNLAYAPHKAISLKIASAIFHNVRLYQKYSDHTKFDSFRISYPEDLAEWVTDERFFYSNNTASQPANLSQLKEIAGCGSSPLVKYNGTGAYFMDKLSDGVWRLEVMPDAYWIEDPYSPVDPRKQKAAVFHTLQQITISLPNLGNNYRAKPINSGNAFNPKVLDGQMSIFPGVYLLKRNEIKDEISSEQKYKNIRINEFVSPSSNLNKTAIWNHSPAEAMAGKPLQLKFEAVSNSIINKIKVVMSNDDRWKTQEAVMQNPNTYQLHVPEGMDTVGFLKYRIIIESSNDTTTFPSGKIGDPWKWDHKDNETYTTRLVPENTPLTIWNAETDWDSSFKIWNRAVNLKPTLEGETTLAIKFQQLPNMDPKNKNNRNYAFKYFFKDKIKGRYGELSQKKVLVVKISNLLSSEQPIDIGLIDKNGSVMATELVLKPVEKIYQVSLNDFKSGSYLVIPRPYPEFLSYSVQTNKIPFDWSSIETIQLMVKPGKQSNVDLNITEICLE